MVKRFIVRHFNSYLLLKDMNLNKLQDASDRTTVNTELVKRFIVRPPNPYLLYNDMNLIMLQHTSDGTTVQH